MGRNVDRGRHSARKRIFEFRPKAFWNCNGGGFRPVGFIREVGCARTNKGRKEMEWSRRPTERVRLFSPGTEILSRPLSRIGLVWKIPFKYKARSEWTMLGSRPNFFLFLSSVRKGQSSQGKLFDLKISWNRGFNTRWVFSPFLIGH